MSAEDFKESLESLAWAEAYLRQRVEGFDRSRIVLEKNNILRKCADYLFEQAITKNKERQ